MQRICGFYPEGDGDLLKDIKEANGKSEKFLLALQNVAGWY